MKTDTNRQQLACNYIRDNYTAFNRLRFDTIAQKVQILKPDPETGEEKWFYLTNADINSIVCDACAEMGAAITSREVLTVLNAGASYIPRVHPLREYVNNLTPYEGHKDWIDFIAQYVHVAAGSEDKWRICFKKWFVGMVAAWIKPEIVNQSVLILVGPQGIFKTTFLESLIPPHLRDYCCKMSSFNQISKDEKLRLAEFGLINLDELDAMSQRELNIMKSIITTTDINERVAYGYTKERRERIASFCGSTNRREFLTDITGNRRFLPFQVINIKSPYQTTIPYDLIYAQARYLIEHDFNYWFDMDDIQAMQEHTDSFRTQESEEQLLPILFDIPAEGRGVFLTTAQISERLIAFGNIKHPMPLNRLGMLLSAAGYKQLRQRLGTTLCRGWIVYQRDSQEIDAMKRILKQ